jgi:hypothetical protein
MTPKIEPVGRLPISLRGSSAFQNPLEVRHGIVDERFSRNRGICRRDVRTCCRLDRNRPRNYGAVAISR